MRLRNGDGLAAAAESAISLGMSRIPVAVALGLAGFLAYVAVVVTLADRVIGQHWALEILYFVIAGIAWVFPARWLMFWAAHKSRGGRG